MCPDKPCAQDTPKNCVPPHLKRILQAHFPHACLPHVLRRVLY